MKVIGLCGYAGSGKDTAAEILVQQGWKQIAFADTIREMALAIDPYVYQEWEGTEDDKLASAGLVRLSTLTSWYGWTEAKRNPEVRRILQRIGTEAGRDILGPSVWKSIAHNRMCKEAAIDTPGVVITDVRFKNEVDLIRNAWKGLIIRIVKPGTGPANSHQSESIIDTITPDAVIYNDYTKEKLWTDLVTTIGTEPADLELRLGGE